MKKEAETQTILHSLVMQLYLTAIATFAVTGIYLNCTTMGLNVFSYYTIQSNMLCLIAVVFYSVLIHTQEKVSNEVLATVKGGVIMGIMLTFLVFHFLLLPTISPGSDILGPGNVFVHYVVPLMMLGDYVLFQQKGIFTFKMIRFWILIPLVYCVFVYIYSFLGGRFGSNNHLVPYFFLDYTIFGITGVILWIVSLGVGYVGFSALFVGIDKLLKKYL